MGHFPRILNAVQTAFKTARNGQPYRCESIGFFIFPTGQKNEQTHLFHHTKIPAVRTAGGDYQNLIVKELEGTKARLKSIQSLMDTINKTQDPKAIAELQGRIQSEQASIQHTQVQLDMLDRMFKMEEKIQQRKYSKQQACYAKQIRSGNYAACR